jgi:hypothetical protein
MITDIQPLTPLSLDNPKLKSLFDSTHDLSLRDFTLATALPRTRKTMEDIDRKFPINERKDFIEKLIVNELPNSVWGENEVKLIVDNIKEEIERRKIKLMRASVDMYMFVLNNISKDMNIKEEEWLGYIDNLKDYKLISIFLEIISVLNLLKRKSSENWKLINLHRYMRDIDKIIKDVDNELITYTMLIIRLYSIIDKITRGYVEQAFKESKYLSLEKLYLV